MIKILSAFSNRGVKRDSSNISFTSKRDDYNSVLILKNDKDPLNVPVQRRIISALERLSKDSSDQNINFLFDVADNLQYGVKDNSQINSAIKGNFKYNYLNIQKGTWSNLLKSSIAKAIENSTSDKKAEFEDRLSNLYASKVEDYVLPPLKNTQKTLAPNSEYDLISLCDEILSSPELKLKKSLRGEDYEEHIDNIKLQMDKFLVSPEVSLAEKKECLEKLKFMLSPEYKINPQLANRKYQVLSEVLTDIAGQNKSINQKHHGSCAGVATARKFMAAEHKAIYVDTIMNELNDSDYMEVFDLFDYSNKVKVQKADVNYETSLDRTYRILDASVHNWMNIADTSGNGQTRAAFFNPFDKANYDMFHDGHYLVVDNQADSPVYFYLRGYEKLNEAVDTLDKIFREKKSSIEDYNAAKKFSAEIDSYVSNTILSTLSKLQIVSSSKIAIKEMILKPQKQTSISPDLKIVQYDENNLKAEKIKKIILSKAPYVSENENLDKNVKDIRDALNLKLESDQKLKDLSEKVKLSSVQEMQNEFKNANYQRALFDVEAFNRVSKEFELATPERLAYYSNVYNIPILSEQIKSAIKINIDALGNGNLDNMDDEEKTFYNALKNYEKVVFGEIPEQLDVMSKLLGFVDFDGQKQMAILSIDALKYNSIMNNRLLISQSMTLNTATKDETFKKLDKIQAELKEQQDAKGLYSVMRKVGIDDQFDLLVLYYNQLYTQLDLYPDIANSLANAFSTNSGQVVQPDEVKEIISGILDGLDKINEKYEEAADVFEIPLNSEIILKKLEQSGEIMTKQELDNVFAMFNDDYKYKEQRTLTDYNIFNNNKYLSQQFEKTADSISIIRASYPPNSKMADDLSDLSLLLREASISLQGVNISKIEKKLRQINAIVLKIEKFNTIENPNSTNSKRNLVKDKKLAGLLNSVKSDLEDKITQPPESLKKDYSMFFKKAAGHYSKVRHDALRDYKFIQKIMSPVVEQDYKRWGDELGHYWIGSEGHSGLYTSQQIRILSQMTGKNFATMQDPTKAAEKISKSRHGAVDSTSVSHKEGAWHAMYVYDIMPNVEVTDGEGNRSKDTLICHDNSWGPKEINGLRRDSTGALRTDYTRKFGQKGGYYVNEGLINGVTLNDFKYGLLESKSNRSKYNSTVLPVFTDMIIEGTSPYVKDKTISIYEDIRDLLNITSYSELLDFVSIDLLRTNPSMKEVLTTEYLTEFKETIKELSQNKDIVAEGSAKKFIEDSMNKRLRTLLDMFKENGENEYLSKMSDFLEKELPSVNFEEKADTQKLINKFQSWNRKILLDNDNGLLVLQPKIDYKKFEKYGLLVDQLEKQIMDMIGYKKTEVETRIDEGKGLVPKIASREAYDKLPANNPLKIILNNISFRSAGDISQEAINYLATNYHEPYAYIQAKSINLTIQKEKMLEALNQRANTKETPHIINSIDDIRALSVGSALIAWIDEKFQPRNDEELVDQYKKLSAMPTYEVKALLDSSSEAELGLKYDDPYEILLSLRAGRKENILSSALYKYVYSKDIMTPKERETSTKTLDKQMETVFSPEGQSISLLSHRGSFIHKINENYLCVPENLYRTLDIEFSNNNLGKFINGAKDAAFRNWHAYPSVPNLKVFDDDALLATVTESFYTLIGFVHTIKKIRENSPDVAGLKEADIRKEYEGLAREFVLTNVQPRYQATAAEMLKKTIKNIHYSEISDSYPLDDQVLKFFVDKHISKDIPALLEHMVKVTPKLDLMNSESDNDIFDAWKEILVLAYKEAKLASIEFGLKSLLDSDSAASATPYAADYLKKILFNNNEELSNVFITSILPTIMSDPINNNHTLKLLYNHFGYTQKAITQIVDNEDFVGFVKSCQDEFKEILGLPNTDPEKRKRALTLYAKLGSEASKVALLDALRDNVSDVPELKDKIAQYISISNSHYDDLAPINDSLEKMLGITNKFEYLNALEFGDLPDQGVVGVK